MVVLMRTRSVLAAVLAAVLALCPTAALAAVKLTLIAGGLSGGPLYVTHAGDGSGRLFIEEQNGLVRVLQPGSSTATVFLDVRSKVAFGGERGLLGLAFHPLYRSNGRFFLYYTRLADGAIVISEFGVSSDPNLANPDETVLLVIPHPVNANHNGGMLAFGPGGYLFIGVGDGGSANDPPGNAQNIDVLLGKILRINVDASDGSAGTPYSVPSSNPFVHRDGRDEIFAYGLRNPWRFSFDRLKDWLWVADVGQNAREEVNAPVVAGRNYGWRSTRDSPAPATTRDDARHGTSSHRFSTTPTAAAAARLPAATSIEARSASSPRAHISTPTTAPEKSSPGTAGGRRCCSTPA